MRSWAVLGCGACSAVKYRPADVVPQPLVVQYELADRLRELLTLPSAFQSPCARARSFGRASACGLDRIGGRTEFGDVRDGPGLLLASAQCTGNHGTARPPRRSGPSPCRVPALGLRVARVPIINSEMETRNPERVRFSAERDKLRTVPRGLADTWPTVEDTSAAFRC